MDLLIFILSTIGLTFIITFFYIFQWLRDYLKRISPKFLGKGIGCPACVGFWAGLIVRSIQLVHLGGIFDIDIILYGFIGSFVSYTAYLLLKSLMDKFDK